jgi:putative endonuclease
LPRGRRIRYLCEVPVQRPEGWCVYLLRCGDGSLYCGVTNDLAARLAAHRSGRGARYTRGRGPLRLVWCEPAEGKGPALQREHAIKRLTAKGKRALIRSLRPAKSG